MTSAIVGLGDVVRQRQAELAEAVVERQFAQPDMVRRYGSVGRATCLQDAHHHLACLADAMNAGNPALFIDYVRLARAMHGARGIPTEDLARDLDFTRTIIEQTLDGEAAALAAAYLDAGLTRLPSVSAEVPTCLGDDAPHGALARAYVEALLDGERHLASRRIFDAVASGTSVKDIYQHVFQVALYEVGRRWQQNELSVAQEHYCTAATQLIMSQLYPRVFAAEKGGGRLVAAGVAGDLHEIGGRMVADFFEIEGWHTCYLGANVPAQGVVDNVVQRQAHVLAISATMSGHLQAVEELIQQVRGHPGCRSVKIMVGGYPFLSSPDLWQRMGADGTAGNAQDAIDLGNRFRPHDGA